MPLVRIAFREGKSQEYRRAVADEVHGALVEAVIYDPTYLGVKRSDDIVMIQITLNQRQQAVKVALYKAIAAGLAKNPGMRSEGVLISLVRVAPEDWSFGDGKAQYVKSE